MTVVLDRPEAKWLPSRHRYALARLVALMALRVSRGSLHSNQQLVRPIDRDQSAIENHTFALWITITTTLYLAALLRPALWILTPLAAGVLLQVPLYVSGLVVAPLLRAIARKPGENNQRINSFVILGSVAAVSAWFAWTLTWGRFVAYFFFAVLAMNAIAFIIMLFLRGVVVRIESRYGGTSFAP